MLCSFHYVSPIGPLTLVADELGLRGIWMNDQKYYLAHIDTLPDEDSNNPLILAACQWLDRYFLGENPPIPLEILHPIGTEFQKTVWNLLCLIPYGTTITYGELACRTAEVLGKSSMSSQAVGGAVGHNPLSIIIPCHRVVGAGGSLTGYAGGIARKQYLLSLEGLDLSHFSVPEKGSAL